MTKRIDIFSILLLLTAGLLVGCSHHNDPTEPVTTAKKEIALKTGVTGRVKRATGIDSNTDLRTKELKIDAYFHGYNTKYLNGVKLVYDTDLEPDSWRFDNAGSQVHYYWPFDGAVYDPASANITYTSLDFVGLCPFDKPANIGTPTYDHSTGVSFTCDMSKYMNLPGQDTLQEYVVAVLNEQTLTTQTAAGGALPLQFKHPLAQIKFVITAASGTNVQIDSISIPGLYTGGTYRYNGETMSWYSLSGSEPIVLNEVNLTVEGTTETTPFYVIPNNYGSKYLTVKCTWDDWSDVTIRNYGTDVNFEWLPGYSYTYNLTVDKYGLKVDVTRYTEQW